MDAIRKKRVEIPFKGSYSTISNGHFIKTILASLVNGPVSYDKYLIYGQGSFDKIGDRMYTSTPATVYHHASTTNKSVVYYCGDGSIWSDAISTYSEYVQRPALQIQCPTS